MNGVQTTWIAAGCSLFGMAVLFALAVEKSFVSLIVSDDAYLASFAITVPVTAFYAMGSVAGWWFQSTRISWITTFAIVVCFSTLLWTVDLVHDFGGGDQVFGYLGIGTLFGGGCGSLAFLSNSSVTRLLLSLAPHLLFVAGYSTALFAMWR